jgi:hypothetical protein
VRSSSSFDLSAFSSSRVTSSLADTGAVEYELLRKSRREVLDRKDATRRGLGMSFTYKNLVDCVAPSVSHGKKGIL